MNPRYVQSQLVTLLKQFPAVLLLGPRQAGKTTLALAEMSRRKDAIYLDLELPSAQRQLVQLNVLLPYLAGGRNGS